MLSRFALPCLGALVIALRLVREALQKLEYRMAVTYALGVVKHSGEKTSR